MRKLGLVGRLWWEDDLPSGREEDLDVQEKRPLVDVEEVVADAFLEKRNFRDLAAEAFALSETGDTGLHVVAGVVVTEELCEFGIVLDHVRARARNAHLAEKDIQELRNFIEAGATEEAAESVDAGVTDFGLHSLLALRLSRVHGPELPDVETTLIDARA